MTEDKGTALLAVPCLMDYGFYFVVYLSASSCMKFMILSRPAAFGCQYIFVSRYPHHRRW